MSNQLFYWMGAGLTAGLFSWGITKVWHLFKRLVS